MTHTSVSRIFALPALFLVLIGGASGGGDRKAALSSNDVAAIRAVLEGYRRAWIANNADAVRGSFTQDAVLMPHHGVPPVVGMASINEFWFPAGPVKTTITGFSQALDEVGGERNLAYVRGTSEVAWTVEAGGNSEHWRNGGNFLAILKKQDNGKWLMSHLIWDDPPNQRVN